MVLAGGAADTVSPRKCVAKYCRKFFAGSGTRNEVKGFSSHWAHVAFPHFLLRDAYIPGSVASSSLGRLAYAFCFLKQKWMQNHRL